MAKFVLGILLVLGTLFYNIEKISGYTTFNESCGITEKLISNEIRVVDKEGEETYPEQWPWLVAISHVSPKAPLAKRFRFKCSGTLISKKHVITAAHCVMKHGKILPRRKVVVSLGKYYLRGPNNDLGSKTMGISKIKIKPRTGKYDDMSRLSSNLAFRDFAILVLKTTVEYSDNIRPICLWNGPQDSENVGERGFIVGWGGSRRLYNDEPRTISAPIVSQEECSRSVMPYRLQKFAFCAGEKPSTGPCIGDSGSAFVLRDQKTGIYHLRGILGKIFTEGKKLCNLRQYSVYLDIAKHEDWIKKQVKNDLKRKLLV